MNRIYILILLFSCVMAKGLAQENKDSLKAQKPKSFPILHDIKSDYSNQIKNLEFESAISTINSKINEAKRKKQDITHLEEQLEVCEKGLTALQATNKIIFIDSIVVDKSNFLSAYKMDEELGTINLTNDKQASSFTNELGNFTYRTEKDAKGNLCIYSYYIEEGKTTNKSPLNGIELNGDMNYPFLLADGTTFYFASRDVEGLGNYDLYVTRFDKEDGTYLQPTNLGFPFNSFANDYMMVVDEDLGIGWFASDRYQPEGKVCVYTFIQPKSRHTYDYEEEDEEVIINAARIRSIKNTWKGNDDVIRSARQALTLKMNRTDNSSNKKYDFTFVVNDSHVYHQLSDFKNQEAKSLFSEYQNKKKSLNTILSTLSQLRLNAKGATIRSQILEMEGQVGLLSSEIEQMEKNIRKLELQ